jgi:hypothetical protein
MPDGFPPATGIPLPTSGAALNYVPQITQVSPASGSIYLDGITYSLT